MVTAANATVVTNLTRGARPYAVAHGLYESLGFDRNAKQAFVISRR